MPLPKILLVHNSYQYGGGEDVAFASEVALLRQNGHEVFEYCRSNRELNEFGVWGKVTLPKGMIWAGDAREDLKRLIGQTRPDVVHFHNTFFMISPAVYRACRAMGVPVVQTLHNYRLLCPAATFFRNGRTCEDCLGKTPPWPGVWHACYRESRAQTAAVAAMLTFHRWLKTWQEEIDVYIALTEFSRQKFIQGGLPGGKIVVKPNFVHPAPAMRQSRGAYALFVGRLSAEKGMRTLLSAWDNLPDIPLKVAGDGPLLDEIAMWVRERGPLAVELLGRRARQEVLALMQGARLLVFPSEWYEGFPMTLAEAFACGVPVIASRLGAMAELVEEGHTGLLFRHGDAEDLAAQVRWAVAHPDAMDRMGESARRVYEEKYTAEKNYHMLLNIYETAISKARLRVEPEDTAHL